MWKNDHVFISLTPCTIYLNNDNPHTKTTVWRKLNKPSVHNQRRIKTEAEIENENWGEEMNER